MFNNITKFTKGQVVCYATSPYSIAIEGLEALKDWCYRGKTRLPMKVKNQTKNLRKYPHYIFCTRQGEVIKVLV